MPDAQIVSDVVADELFCPSCGYNLHGIEITRCPECGLQLDSATLSLSVIPWTHRAEIGRWGAFWRTIWLASRHPRKLAQDVARPVSFADAQRFRWLVVLTAWVPLCAVALGIRAWFGAGATPTLSGVSSVWSNSPLPAALDLGICLWVGWVMWPVPSIAFFLCLAGVSGVASYFFHPKSLHITRQNRAIALSMYACAPLAVTILPCVFFSVAGWMSYAEMNAHYVEFQVFVVLVVAGFGTPLGLLFACWYSALHLLHPAARCSAARVVTGAVLLPLMWLVIAILTLAVFPILCGFVELLIRSYVE